jgi:hypothetical protein
MATMLIVIIIVRLVLFLSFHFVVCQVNQGDTNSQCEGKLADLVILDANPLKVEPAALWDLRVLETIKEAETIYKAE